MLRKQTTQAFQKTNATTASTAQVNGTMKIKQEPIMSIGNKNAYGRRQPNNMNKKKSSDRKEGENFTDTKTCTRCILDVYVIDVFFNSGHI